ncbi:hypothetical protein A3D00_05270 [Candidatus Woesebacteria bacterium RIFCSPHIGHO2_02_FULL_38_9]|uniref:LytR/CpsA/Psr regulator C-terminal domain-containing protein n=1 Tax=Candidatus Woesebacteria bacterium RIFCSPHIGHO2_01_FULL_39_28 TaxID=1802496 RepID=A0A1F7YFZ5_9BACT|nr:MAG: hypothetical protein A2627_04260 [Candidatus Woesebacteria bacterium RIFCSPHIGHO2_01_FULL_39_28]OGM33708.1 MAG: hypothetical protein A3D00_05270 [Candidatus Woesebacteria bacterium RIFCSPHIGHO2_02_FULL_38_9]OGM58428.1 MAG: hypothetical protein A3A50_00965 [Candidatus Woesebacteria bacterium RIFCSPLOWO2_01_FULL_38_20]
MKKDKLINSVAFLDRNYMVFYDGKSFKSYTFNFPVNSVRDLEIKSRDEVTKELKMFLEKNKVAVSKICLVLSRNVYFEEDLPLEVDESAIEAETNRFESLIPFSNVGVMLFRSEKSFKLIGVNKDFWESFREILDSLGFMTFSVIPAFALGNSYEDKPFDVNSAKAALRKFNSFTEFSFLSNIAVVNLEQGPLGNKTETKRTKLLIIIFVVLLIAFVVLFILTRAQTKPAPTRVKSVTQPIIIPTSFPTVSLTVTPLVTSAPENIKINILNGSGKAGQADLLRQDLNKIDFTTVDIAASVLSSSKTTMIGFTTSTPADIKQKIFELVKIRYPDISIQDSESSVYDVVITIGNLLTK